MCIRDRLRTEHNQRSCDSDLYRRLKADKEASVVQLSPTNHEITNAYLTTCEVKVEATTEDIVIRFVNFIAVVHTGHYVRSVRVVVPARLIVHVRLARYHYG